MRAALTYVPNQPNLVELHMSCELPLFPPPFRPRYPGLGRTRVLCRDTHLSRLAEHLCRINLGKFSLELPRPRETFLAFLEELVLVKGLVRVVDVARYSLTLETGRCFSCLAVCQALADCVVRHFYPTETVVVQSYLKVNRPESNKMNRTRVTDQSRQT